MQSAFRRFEVVAAYVLGIALPVLEVCRRRTDFSDIPGYIDDFIAGALLLVAARAATLQRRYSDGMLAAAWGVLCGGLWASFFGQLHNASSRDISGLSNVAVVLVKLLIYCTAIVALALSIRRSGSENLRAPTKES